MLLPLTIALCLFVFSRPYVFGDSPLFVIVYAVAIEITCISLGYDLGQIRGAWIGMFAGLALAAILFITVMGGWSDIFRSTPDYNQIFRTVGGLKSAAQPTP
jgi:hypothetical protein